MDAPVGIVGLVFIGVIVYVVYVNWLLRRAAPTDRPAVDDFANQHGLRIISVTRSSNFFSYLFLFGGRLYEIAVEDFEGRRGTIEVGFDSLLGPGRPIILGQQGIPFIGSDGSASLKQPDSRTARPAWTWTERLVLFVVGAGIGGFLFCGALHTYLSPPNRPIIAEPELGYAHLFKAKHGDVYGIFFEYLAVTYGPWISWGIGVVASTFIYFLNIRTEIARLPLANPGRGSNIDAAILRALACILLRCTIMNHEPRQRRQANLDTNSSSTLPATVYHIGLGRMR